MAKISLRAYIQEINDMVDQRLFDEAVAHCRHVLETFPKHIDTYRLLGKTFLEDQRYGDASDILQRVLSSIPEDFIAQVGMSIIREDEGNLDSAIYHMERAFETQPSNHAIQGELRRLYGLREGMETPRVRLTRGALARMYAHGHLYDQAIAELQAALADEPNRFDLQSLLAEMYYQTDRKVDAAETCTAILEKLPYCLTANRLLTLILRESERLEESKRYLQRWSALEPYAAFVDENSPMPDLVADNLVQLEHLDFDSGLMTLSQSDQPAWASSLGLSIAGQDEPEERVPDWLEDTDRQTPSPTAPTEFLSGDARGELEQEDWLSEIRAEEEQPDEPAIEEDHDDDWLADFDNQMDDTLPSAPVLSEESEPADDDDWLASLQEDQGDTLPAAALHTDEAEPEEEEDWLASLNQFTDETAPTEVAEDESERSPVFDDGEEEEEEDWLASLQAGTAETAPTLLAADEEEEEEPELPEFLRDAGWEPGDPDSPDDYPPYQPEASTEDEGEIVQSEIPDWIKEMAPPEAGEEIDEEYDEGTEADPEWLQSLDIPAEQPRPEWIDELDTTDSGPAEDTEPSEQAGLEIEPDEDELAWLENLASKQGVPEEELITSPEQRASLPEQEPDSAEPALPEGTGDDTAVWLSSLAQKEGAPAEDSDDTISRFLAAKQAAEEPEDAALPDDEPIEGVLEEEDDFDTDWLRRIGQQASEEAIASEQAADQEDLTSIEETGQVSAPPPVFDSEEDFPLDWLDEMEDDSAEAQPDQAGPITPAARTPEEDDDWLAALSAGQDSRPVDEPVLDDEDDLDMDWLDQISKQAAEEASSEASAAEDTPDIPPVEEDAAAAEEDWLSALDETEDEPDQPAPAPILEEEDDFDMDWLEQIGQEAAEEASGQDVPGTDQPAAPVLEDEDDFDMDWLDQIGQEAAEEASAAADSTVPPAGQPEADQVVDDDFDMDWLEQVGKDEEAQSDEPVTAPPPAEDRIPAPSEPGVPDEIAEDDGEDWLERLETEQSPDDSIADTDAWLRSMEAPDQPEEAEEEPDFDLGDTGSWLASIGVTAESPTPDTTDQPRDQAEPEPLEEDDLPPSEPEAAPGIQPTTLEEWQPEEFEESESGAAAPQPASAPAPVSETPEAMIESARNAINSGQIEDGLKQYSRLIRKGKLLEEIVRDLSFAADRFPINVQLWQTLGDAHLRMDNLQEALDAYSQAENLLR